MENSKSLLKKALKLKPQEKYLLIEGLIQSLDEPDKNIEKIWLDEAEKRLNAYRKGELQTASYKDVFGEDI